MSKFKYKLILIFLISILRIKFTFSINIIPDPQNPILIKYPDQSNSPEIQIRFSFHKDSKGLLFDQLISLVFPKNIQSDLNFEIQQTPKYSCSLTDGKITYLLTPIIPLPTNEGNLIFCKLTDPINSIIKHNINLTLTIKLIGIKFSTNFLRSFSLFTTTTNKPERIIIDQL